MTIISDLPAHRSGTVKSWLNLLAVKW